MKLSILLSIGLCLAMAACGLVVPQASSSQITDTPQLPTASPSPEPTEQPSMILTPTIRLPSPTSTPGPFQALAHIQMFTLQDGWAVSGMAHGQARVLQTRDGGLNWKDVTPAYSAGLLSAIFLDATMAWILTGSDVQSANPNGILYRTMDGGVIWESFPVPFSLGGMTFFNANDGRAVADLVCGAGTCIRRLYQTVDGGQTWQPIEANSPAGPEALPTVFPSGSLHSLTGDGYSFQNASTIWFGGNGCCAEPYAELYVSRDNGQTWQQEQMPLPERDSNSGSPDFITLPVFLTGQDGFFTANYEGTQIDKSNGDFFNNYLLATYVTHNSGQTWESTGGLVEDVSAYSRIEFLSMDDIFLPCGSDLCTSHDGGQTWQAIPSNLAFDPQANQALIDFDFVDPTTGWAIVGSSDENRLFQTTDGGATWEVDN